MIRNLALIFLLACSGKACMAQTTILGSAGQWPGKIVRLVALTDPVTESEITVDTDTIGLDGSFVLRAEPDAPAQYWLYVKRYRAPVILEPGTTYRVKVDPIPENKLVDTWLKGSFSYYFINPDSLDVNALIEKFDQAYYAFYLDNAHYINSPQIKRKINAFALSEVDSAAPPFTLTYTTASVAQMKLTAGFSPLEIYQTYLKGKPVYPDNPAWYHFLDLFYADYFQNFNARFGGQNLSVRIPGGYTADSLYQAMGRDPFLDNDTLRQWVILKSVKEVSTMTSYPKTFLNQLLDITAKKAVSPRITEVTALLQKQISPAIPGLAIDSLSNMLRGQPTLAVNGKYSLVMISQAGNSECMREGRFVQSLLEKYGDIFTWAEIRIDAPIRDSLPPNVYTAKNQKKLLDRLEVYSFPWFIWVGPEGEIRDSGPQKPSEFLEARLFKIRYEREQENKIKIGH